MFNESTPQEHFVASVEVPFDLRFVSLVQNWATGITEIAGSDSRETEGIRVALEETLAFIIEAYPDAESWELIRIEIKMMTEGTADISVSNAGPPVHLDRIPNYNPEAPSEAGLDGLWYFLASKMVDNFEFKNLGMDGWLAAIKQNIANPCLEKDGRRAGSSTMNLPKKLKFTSRLATSQDAGDLMNLTYDTYRYSYPGEEFYYKSKLEQAIKNNDIVSVLVETDGNIVGSSCISIPQDTPHCAYMGSMMVRRAYRRTRAVMYIIRETDQYIHKNPLGVDIYYGTMVTEHSASQKAGAKVGLHPLALLLAVGAPVDYRGMNIRNGIRESFIICSRLTVPTTLEKIYLPAKHQEIMRPLLDKVGCDAEFAWEEESIQGDETSYLISEDDTEGSAYITVKQLGKDWTLHLRKLIFNLHARQLRSITILVPAWKQPPVDIDDGMSLLNAIFTGVKPVSTSEYYLVYCAVSDLVNFDRIVLADPLADDLKKHVQQLYNDSIML